MRGFGRFIRIIRDIMDFTMIQIPRVKIEVGDMEIIEEVRCLLMDQNSCEDMRIIGSRSTTAREREGMGLLRSSTSRLEGRLAHQRKRNVRKEVGVVMVCNVFGLGRERREYVFVGIRGELVSKGALRMMKDVRRV